MGSLDWLSTASPCGNHFKITQSLGFYRMFHIDIQLYSLFSAHPRLYTCLSSSYITLEDICHTKDLYLLCWNLHSFTLSLFGKNLAN